MLAIANIGLHPLYILDFALSPLLVLDAGSVAFVSLEEKTGLGVWLFQVAGIV